MGAGCRGSPRGDGRVVAGLVTTDRRTPDRRTSDRRTSDRRTADRRTSDRRTPDRRASVVVGVVLLVEAVGFAVVLAVSGAAYPLPVTVALPGVERFVLASVEAGAAAVVLCAVAGIARLLRFGWVRLVEFSVSASITVFLVAQLNGITDVGALVAIYALTSALALFVILQERVTVDSGHPLLPLCLGAGVGIVPWGIIAFHQVGAGLVGVGPSPLVRFVTLVMLGFAIVFLLREWRAARGRPTPGYPLLSAIATSVFAWFVVLGFVLG